MKNIKSEKKEKRKIKNLKVYFLIVNLLISVIAFSFLISAAGTGTTTGSTPVKPPATPGTTITPPSTSTSGTSSTNPPTSGTQNDIPIAGGSGLPPGIINIGTGQGGATPPGTGGTPPIGTGGTGGTGGVDNINGGGGVFNHFGGINVANMITMAGFGASVFGTIGALAGGDNGALWGSLAGSIGGLVAGILQPVVGDFWGLVIGAGIALAIFILTYKKKSQESIEFHCLPWQAPIGGNDCEYCNQFKECSQYSCKSLGQACDIINEGTKEQKCIWKNPHDVNSPKIQVKALTKGHTALPDGAVRPPATGVKIVRENEKCIKAFTPLEFIVLTDEPSQCKIDYNLTVSFDEMTFYVGGNNLYAYNHTEKLSLPGPDAINAVAPEIKNDGNYRLLVRCRDANGNFNQDAFSVSFCVEKGPDTTPPVIVSASIPSGNPILFNKSELDLEVYINEPSECKWSKEDRSYDNMENKMECSTNLWEMNNKNVYTCKTTLKGIENRKENLFYFRCKDQPQAEEKDRNTNSQSYLYKIIGTQPLNILSIKPDLNNTISGSTDYSTVFLEIETDNGYKNGESMCYYCQGKPLKEEDYILFSDTGRSTHKQRQDLPAGFYSYYFKCIDLGGNTVYNSTSFKIDVDKTAPIVVRVYRETELKIITDERAECSYSVKDCNYEIDSGIKMISNDYLSHTADWKVNQNFYIRCKDKYENQPNPNACSIIVRPSKTSNVKEVIEIM